MRAVVIREHLGPQGIRVEEVAEPEPRHDLGDEVVTIEVHAAGVSFPELLQSWGKYQHSPDLPFVPGLEVAGIVRQAPPGAFVAPGDRVMAFTNVGGLAEVAVAPLAMTFALPDAMDFAEGAAVIVNMHTAYFALVTRARIAAGDVVVVHGAAGGLGTCLVAIARALGARVIAIASTEEKMQVAAAAGAHEVVRADEEWPAGVRALAPGGVDIVCDPVGGSRTIDSLRVLSRGGRYVVLGFTEGQIPEVKVNRLLLNNLDLVGAGWGAYVRQDDVAFRAIGDAVVDLLNQGVRPVVGHRVPLARAGEAFALLADRQAMGKVVVEIA